jgi:hypothetical protein
MLRMSRRAMMYKIYAVFLMSLGIALALASDQAFGGPKGGAGSLSHCEIGATSLRRATCPP